MSVSDDAAAEENAGAAEEPAAAAAPAAAPAVRGGAKYSGAKADGSPPDGFTDAMREKFNGIAEADCDSQCEVSNRLRSGFGGWGRDERGGYDWGEARAGLRSRAKTGLSWILIPKPLVDHHPNSAPFDTFDLPFLIFRQFFLKSFIFALGDNWKDIPVLLKDYRKAGGETGMNHVQVSVT